MKLWLKILLVLFVLGIAIAVLIWVFIINKPKPNYETKKADYTLDAKELYTAFKTGKAKSDSLYNGKTIQISGILSKVETTDSQVVAVFVFEEGDFGDQGIRCTFLPKFRLEKSRAKGGINIKIKGHCVGYDDTDVKFTDCSVIK